MALNKFGELYKQNDFDENEILLSLRPQKNLDPKWRGSSDG